MIYLCIYNPITREIEGDECYDDVVKADERSNMYQVEAFARGAPWTAYRGDKPFSFEEATIEGETV